MLIDTLLQLCDHELLEPYTARMTYHAPKGVWYVDIDIRDGGIVSVSHAVRGEAIREAYTALQQWARLFGARPR